MLALYGGSFDPPHLGHAKSIIAAANEVKIDNVDFLPCARSPLKNQTGANDEQRLAMLEIVCNTFNQQQLGVTLGVNKTELSLPSPSYTINTLSILRKQLVQSTPLIFFLGEDSLYTLHKWKDWKRLCELCHLVVLRREMDSAVVNRELSEWLKAHTHSDVNQLHESPHGSVYMCNTPLVTVSSTDVRNQLASSAKHSTDWLTRDVYDYINKHHIYKNLRSNIAT